MMFVHVVMMSPFSMCKLALITDHVYGGLGCLAKKYLSQRPQTTVFNRVTRE